MLKSLYDKNKQHTRLLFTLTSNSIIINYRTNVLEINSAGILAIIHIVRSVCQIYTESRHVNSLNTMELLQRQLLQHVGLI